MKRLYFLHEILGVYHRSHVMLSNNEVKVSLILTRVSLLKESGEIVAEKFYSIALEKRK